MTKEDLWQLGLNWRIQSVNQTAVFTPGPASLCSGNLQALGPAFGRCDVTYEEVEKSVLDALLYMTGHEKIVRMQGSATLALEIAIRNFAFGRVLVVSSGYYAARLANFARLSEEVSHVDEVEFDRIQEISGEYDWVMACHVETSRALKLSMPALRALSDRAGARLLVDATASIGLEDRHELADLLAYSSCKGLCGLTGASFIAFNGNSNNEVNSFYLDLQTHLEKKVTGPYHVIQSLAPVLRDHDSIRFAVSANKAAFMRRFGEYVALPVELQPQLCTHVLKRLVSANPALMYQPRETISGSIVCHLGEAHLGRLAKGQLVETLDIS
jgi:2-aminoethylphosphonate-pyruvate transaminase